MIKYFCFVLLFVALLSFATAGIKTNADYENSITFGNYEYPEIEIVDKNFFDVFGWFEETILTTKITTHTTTCMINCETKGQTIISKKANLFDSIEFKDKKLKKKTLDFEVYILEEVFTNSTKELGYDKNNDSITNWTWHTEDLWVVYDWKKLDPGVYDWKVVGHKGIKDSIDWIPTIEGQEILSWAWWDALPGLYANFSATGFHQWTVPSGVSNVSVLLVGGGGGGGDGLGSDGAGGAGAGDVIFNSTVAMNGDATLDIWVGAGGTGGTGGNNGDNGIASNITINSYLINSIGGGGGAGFGNVGSNGASGGGGHADSTGTAGGTGTGVNGNDGGAGDGGSGGSREGGGGGGASAVGENGATGGTGHGGDGGAGLSFYGEEFSCGGGGGGASNNGGTGGCSTAGNGGDASTATSATANFGGGGGGSGTAADDGGTGGSGLVFIRYTASVSSGPVVDFHWPTNNQLFTTTAVLANATVYDDSGNFTVQFLLDGVLNQTNTSSFNNTIYTFPVDLVDGTYTFRINATDNETLSTLSDIRTITIDTIVPLISVTAPTGTKTYGMDGGSELLNATFTDTNLDKCWYGYNNINTTISCATGVLTSNAFTLNGTDFSITVYANDTAGNFDSATTTWTYEFFEMNQSYNPIVLEQSIESFTLYVFSSVGFTSANVLYNNTENPSNIFSLGGSIYRIVSTFTVPSITATTNFTFIHNTTTLSGTFINSSANVQEVNPVEIGNCSTYNYTVLNASLYDERLLNRIVGEIEVDLDILSTTGETVLSTISTEFYNVSWGEVCSSINLTATANLYSLEMRYYSDPQNDSNFLYVPEFYHIQEALTSTFPNNINLYGLSVNESTEFTISYRDDNYISRPNVLLQIERKYVNEGIFRTIEIPITSSEGTAIGHFDLNNYKYRITVTLNGVVLNVFNNPAIACESELSGICTLSLSGQGNPSPYTSTNTDTDFSYVITINDTLITAQYIIPSGSTKSVNIVMTQTSPFTDPVTLCDNTLVSSAGSLTCTASTTIGDSQVLVDMTVDGVLYQNLVYYQEDLAGSFLLNNYVIAALFLILMITMVVSSPKIMVLMSIISIVVLGFLFLIKGSSIGNIVGAMSWLIISGIIILIKINKKDET